MVIDLEMDKEMHPTVALLYATVKDTYKRLKILVSDITQEELDYKGPTENLNSIGQLLKHLSVVDLHWVYRLKNEPIPTNVKLEYGPMIHPNGKLPSVNNVSINELITAYDRVQKMFHLECTKLSEDDLNQVVSYENGKRATIRWGIWHIADHNRYHQAHISFLKKIYREKQENI
ncbi:MULTISPECIES: DinB family protein [unclassified Bacillus cereus group]|uniref:DinB family protein n=1 Tax=unclassified Bacillus cereus group TaxID=2750818 RepID=UPI0024121BB6